MEREERDAMGKGRRVRLLGRSLTEDMRWRGWEMGIDWGCEGR